MIRFTGLIMWVLVVGCSKPATPLAGTGLTFEGWQQLPIAEKYTAGSLERLREGDPKLQSPEAWQAYQRKIIMPARRKELANAKRS